MLEDLPHLPGLQSTALLGDLYLLAGDRASAGRVYLDAWRQGEISGLVSYAALEADNAPNEIWAQLGTELRDAVLSGDVGQERGEELGRLLVSVLALVRGAVPEAGALALDVLRAAPCMSFPLALRGVEVSPGHWLGACRSLWDRLSATEDVNERGHLIFRLHHLSIALSIGEVSRDDVLMDLAAQGATGALLYLVLRRLDRLAESGPRTADEPAPPVSLGGAEIERTSYVTTQEHNKIGNFLKFLAHHVQDRRERSVFRTRYADWLWAQGELDEAAEAYGSLVGEGPVPVSDLARERLQRLCVARGRWEQASSMALERAERCDDIPLRMALLLLSLAYLYHADLGPEAYMHIAERVLGLEGRGRQLPPAPFKHAYEIVEGALLETGQWDRLRELWGRGAVAAGVRPKSPRMPDRSIESLVLGWSHHQVGTEERLATHEGRLLRRLMLVRALRDRHLERALLLLSRSNAPSEGEALLKAALTLGVSVTFEDNVDKGSLTAEAREFLMARLIGIKAITTRELVALYVLRADLKRQGRLDEALDLFEKAMALCSPGMRAALAAVIGRDLFDAGEIEEALILAREAFALQPTDKAVRELYAELARRTGDERALAQLADFVDDEELTQMLSEAPRHAERFAHAQKLATRGAMGAVEASEILESLSEEVVTSAAQAALLRRAAELRWTSGDDPERSARLALDAVKIRSNDRLAVRTALDILLSGERFEEVAALIEQIEGLSDPSEQLASRLLEGGRLSAERGQPEQAISLYREALLSLPPHRAADIEEALDALQTLYIEAKDPWKWRDLLERMLGEPRPPEMMAMINGRLGWIYEHHLPDRELAIEHYRAALLGDGARAEALEALERLFSEAQRYSELAEILRARAEGAAKTDDPEAGHRQAAYLEALARVLADKLGQVTEAREVLDEVLAHAPRNLQALLKAADLDRQLERWESLVGNLENAARQVEDQRQRSELYHQIGYVYEQLAQTNLALENYMVSFICDNRNVATFGRLEQLYHRAGRWNELVGIYDVAIDAVRQEPECGYNAEQLYARKSQVEFYHLERERAAAMSLLEALRLNPGEERYAKLLENIVGQERAPEILSEAYKLQIEGLPGSSAQRRPLMHQLAKAYERMGNMQAEAIEVYRGILSEWPNDQLAAEHIEALCKRLERWDDLVGFYQERLAAASNPEAVIPLYWAIAQVAERKLRDLELAVSTYEALLEVIPGNLDVLRALARLFEATKQWDRLVEVSRREVKLTEQPEKKAHVFFKLGSIHETVNQDLDEAIECYESAVELDPRCVPALHGLREIYRRQGRWEKVVQTLEREARLWEEPREKASIHTMIADVYRDHLDDLAQAERHVRDALRLSETFTGALRRLLEIHMAQERWAEADEIAARLTNATEGKPDKERARIFAMRARIARSLGALDEAAAWLRIALDLDPDHLEAFEDFLAVIEDPEGESWRDPDLESFLGELERHLAERGLTDGLVRLTIHRGRLCERAVDMAQALSFFKQAVEISPLSVPAHRSWAQLLLRLRRFDEATQIWRGLLARLDGLPNDEQTASRVAVWLELGDLYTDWKRVPEMGMQCYEQALALWHDHPVVLYQTAQCAFLLGRWHDARKMMEALLEAEDADKADSSALARRQEIAGHFFYLGRILELGFGDDEQALLAYSRAKNLTSEDIRPVVAAARVLYRHRNWLRLDNLLRGSIAALERSKPDQALILRMIVADSCVGRGNLVRAREAYEEVLGRAEGDLLRQARTALAAVLRQLPDGGAQALELLSNTLDEATADAEMLGLMARQYQAQGEEVQAWGVIDAIETIGAETEASEQGRAIRLRHPWLGHPPQGPIDAEALANFAILASLQTPTTRALAALSDVLSRAFPTSDEVVAPAPPAAASPQTALRDRVARSLGAESVRRRLVSVPVGSAGAAVRCVNQRMAGTGGDHPLGLVSVAFEVEGVQETRAERIACFLYARGLEVLRLQLAPCAAMNLADLGHCLEVIGHALEGGDLAALQSRPHLTHALGCLVQAKIVDHLDAAIEVAREVGPASAPQSPAEARSWAERLLEAIEDSADRVGLVACGDLSAALDAIIALETGTIVTTLSPEARREALDTTPRARRLMRYAVGANRLALLERLAPGAPSTGESPAMARELE